jgi:hypothetical protein
MENAMEISIKMAKDSHPLAKCVLNKLGGGQEAISYAQDAANHGADSGFVGFTYYSDTVEFFKKNRKLIVESVNQMANELGESPAEMVINFGCLAGRIKDEREKRKAIEEYRPSAYRCLGDGRLTDDDINVANALAWFALEEVGNAIESLSE